MKFTKLKQINFCSILNFEVNGLVSSYQSYCTMILKKYGIWFRVVDENLASVTNQELERQFGDSFYTNRSRLSYNHGSSFSLSSYTLVQGLFLLFSGSIYVNLVEKLQQCKPPQLSEGIVWSNYDYRSVTTI